eukprot:g4814.t1
MSESTEASSSEHRDIFFKKLRRASEIWEENERKFVEICVDEGDDRKIKELAASKQKLLATRENVTKHANEISGLQKRAKEAQEAVVRFEKQIESNANVKSPLEAEHDRLRKALDTERDEAAVRAANCLLQSRSLEMRDIARLKTHIVETGGNVEKESSNFDEKSGESSSSAGDRERCDLLRLRHELLRERSELLAEAAASQESLMAQLEVVKRTMRVVMNKKRDDRKSEQTSLSKRHAAELASLRSSAESARCELEKKHESILKQLRADHEKDMDSLASQLRSHEESELRALREQFERSQRDLAAARVERVSRMASLSEEDTREWLRLSRARVTYETLLVETDRKLRDVEKRARGFAGDE